MSERPRRNPKPIQRIENEQARNAEAAAARAAARPKTAKPRTAKPKINNIQPQNKRNLSPKNAQSRVLAILDSLSQGKNDKIYNILYSIYRDAASTLFTRLELDDNALIASIEEQYKVVSDNIRQAGGAKNTLSLNFKRLTIFIGVSVSPSKKPAICSSFGITAFLTLIITSF